MTPEQKTTRFNVMGMKGEIPEEVIKEHTHYKIIGDTAARIALEDKYVVEEAEPQLVTPQAPVAKDPYEVLNKEKATKAYRAMIKTARYNILKEEVLLDHNHTCRCCDKQFKTRSEHIKSSQESYPLVVRCIIPPVQYFLSHSIFTNKVACTDEKLFDPTLYVALCTDCKPLGFGRK